MKSNQVRDILIREGIFSKSDRGKIEIAVQESPVHRRAEKATQRYTVTLTGKPKYSVKYLPPSWRFRPEDILRTYQVYSQLESIRVPKLVAHLKVDNGYLFIEEFLQDAVPLDKLVEQKSVSGIHAADLLRTIFSELYARSTLPSAEFLKSETAHALMMLKEFFRERYAFSTHRAISLTAILCSRTGAGILSTLSTVIELCSASRKRTGTYYMLSGPET